MTSEKDSTIRQHPSWIDSFVEYTDRLPSPRTLRYWAGLVCLSGVTERRVFTRLYDLELYPNILALLVAPPGVGKSVAIAQCYHQWVSCGQFNIAPDSITEAGFIDQLIDHSTKPVDHQGDFTNSILAAIREFGTFLVAHDTKFLNVMNEVYDCGPIYRGRTRGGGLIEIDKPHMAFISGTQPKYLGDLLPESAYGQGYMSRMILIWSAEKMKLKAFGGKGLRTVKGEKSLVSDLKVIANLTGEMKWSEETQVLFQSWLDSDCAPEPTHSRLQDYNTRRHVHIAKLSMIHSLSRGGDLMIIPEDYLRARADLEAAEDLMPEIYKGMAADSDAHEMREVYEFVRSQQLKTRDKEGKTRSVPESSIVYFLSQRLPTHRVDYVLEMMLRAKMITSIGPRKDRGHRLFRAVPRDRHGIGNPDTE